MATYITPTVIASSALATLYNTTVLLPLVNRDYDGDFRGKQGDTITVRKPWVPTAPNEFNRSVGIVLQDPAEQSFTVALDKLLDISFPITAEDLTLRLSAFEEQLLNPALESFSQDIDGRIAEQLVDAAESVGGGGTVNATGTSAGDRVDGFTDARTVLTLNKLPFSERYAALSPQAVGVILKDDLVLQANTSGTTEALRQAGIGRLIGFDTYETQTLGTGAGDKGQADGVAFHRSAVAFVSRTLQDPMGLPSAQLSVQNYKGLGLRVAKAYDINKKQDIISIDLLCGVSTIRKEAAVQLNFGQGS